MSNFVYIPYKAKHNFKYGQEDTTFNPVNYKKFIRDQDFDNAINYISQFRLKGEDGLKQRALINKLSVQASKLKAQMNGLEDDNDRQALQVKFAFDNNIDLPDAKTNRFSERYNNLMTALGSKDGEIADGIVLRMESGKNGHWYSRFFNIYNDENATTTFERALGACTQEDFAALGISVSENGGYKEYRINKSNENIAKFLRASQTDGLDEGKYKIVGYKSQLDKKGKTTYRDLGEVTNRTEIFDMNTYSPRFLKELAAERKVGKRSLLEKGIDVFAGTQAVYNPAGHIAYPILKHYATQYGDVQSILSFYDEIDRISQNEAEGKLEGSVKEIQGSKTNYKTAEHARLKQYLDAGYLSPAEYNVRLKDLDEKAKLLLNADLRKYNVYSNFGSEDGVLDFASEDVRAGIMDLISKAEQDGDRIEMQHGYLNDVYGSWITINANKGTDKTRSDEENAYDDLYTERKASQKITVFVEELEKSKGVDLMINDPSYLATTYANNINNYGAKYTTEDGQISANDNYAQSSKPFVKVVPKNTATGVIYENKYLTFEEMQMEIAKDIHKNNIHSDFETNIALAGNDIAKQKEAIFYADRAYKHLLQQYNPTITEAELNTLAKEYLDSLLAPYGLSFDD